MPRMRLAVGLAAVLSVCGCTGGPAPNSATQSATVTATLGTTPTSTATATPNTTPPATAAVTPTATPTAKPSAARDLAAFVAAARAADIRLRNAAVLVNGAVRPTTLVVDARTAQAVQASKPSAVQAAIPAGMPPRLVRAVLLAFSDLVSRHQAMRSFLYVGTYPRDPVYDDTTRCLANGPPAKARFPADLAAVVTLARSTPPLQHVAATSQASAELAVRLEHLRVANAGCDSCGGDVETKLITLVWNPAALGATTRTGTIGSIDFTATFATGGWTVHLNAC